MRYQFTQNVVVEGVRYEAGAIVPASVIPPGSLQSCKRCGFVVELPPEPAKPVEQPKAVEPVPTKPTPSAKK